MHIYFFLQNFLLASIELTFKKGNYTAFSPISYAWSALDDHVYIRKMLNFNNSFTDIFLSHEMHFCVDSANLLILIPKL